jgi:hypothetical protein
VMGSKKQKLCLVCHSSKFKCTVGRTSVKKLQSHKTENKEKPSLKKKTGLPGINIMKLDGENGALDSITKSFQLMAEEIRA